MRTTRFRYAVALALPAITMATSLVVARAVSADSAPPVVGPSNPVTVSADALPTVQINGVVWSQVVVGNTVYVAGSFTRARPAGSPAGSNETVRNNILAYDITTGALITSFAPSLNAQALEITASPNGQRIYVGGDFTQVNGQTRNRVAAFTPDGTLVSNFAPAVLGQVDGLAATNDVVYIGGNFSVVNNENRQRLAAVSASNGALLPWDPIPGAVFGSNTVTGLVVTNGGAQVVVSGRFGTMNGTQAVGLAAVDGVTGATRTFAVSQLIENQGLDAGILHVSTDGTNVYASGYSYGGPQNLEGTVAASVNGGALVLVNECKGDTYASFPTNGVLYVASHTHNCTQISGSIEQDPRVERRATAYTTTPTTKVLHGSDGSWVGKPGGTQLAFNPSIAIGSYTGLSQAAWSVTGNSQYVSYGGEFPEVNGTPQQGLVRFALPSVPGNPNDVGPITAGFVATANISAPGVARISWPETWDYDNEYLTYRLYRDDDTVAPIYTATRPSRWWNLERMGFSDMGQSGPHRYRVRATDPFGNSVATPWIDVTISSGNPSARPYVDLIRNDGAVDHWSLAETSGVGYNDLGGNDLNVGSGISRGQPGAIVGDTNTAWNFGGSGFAATQRFVQSTNVFTIEAWFRATGGSGGKILGFGNSNTGTSSVFDRHIYMNTSGRILFGVRELNQQRTLLADTNFRDSQWHHVAATLSPAGMALYVDGVLRGSRSDTTVGPNYYGYWRVGGDATWSGAQNFNGRIDEVAIYQSALSPTQITNHYRVGNGQQPLNVPPLASFTHAENWLAMTVDASSSSDPDGTITGYAWDFGDGTTGTGASAAHTYAAAGTYAVRLTVTDNSGAVTATTQNVTVAAPPPGSPIAQFTHSVTGPIVLVNGSASTDPDGSITGYEWNFGDGTIGTGATTSHRYTATGTYAVTLTVTDNSGLTASTSAIVTITDVITVPVGSGYVPTVPERLLETRVSEGQIGYAGPKPVAGQTIELVVTGVGVAAVPGDAVAVALNMTVTGTEGDGYLTVWPCGQPQPTASNLNYSAGMTIPNLVITGVGDGGKVCIFTLAGTDVVADINGWVPAGSAYVPAVPERLLETRVSEGQIGYAGPKPVAGQTIELVVTGVGVAAVPGDAVAVALNMTVTGTEGDGYLTVWPCGQPQPTASNLNYSAGMTIPNLVITGVGDGGKVCIFTLAGTDVVADINGWMPAGSDYVPAVPERLLETRVSEGQIGYAGPKPVAGQTIELVVTGVGVAAVPGDAVAVALNMTVTGTEGDGYLTVWPCGQPQPTASNLNYSAGMTIPNLVITGVGDGGKVCIFTLAGTDVLADINGAFLAP